MSSFLACAYKLEANLFNCHRVIGVLNRENYSSGAEGRGGGGVRACSCHS